MEYNKKPPVPKKKKKGLARWFGCFSSSANNEEAEDEY
jgi:hypothetical protein